MKHTSKFHVSRLVAVCAAVVMVMVLASVGYAADVGGIQRTVQIWINGDQTDAVLDIQGMNYTLTYEDQDGVSHEIGGGGVAYDGLGGERPLTEEEILEELNAPNVEYRDDGSAWVYCRGEAIEITDRFDEDGICYVQLKTDNGPLYLTIKYMEGYSSSPHSYPSPRVFDN